MAENLEPEPLANAENATSHLSLDSTTHIDLNPVQRLTVLNDCNIPFYMPGIKGFRFSSSLMKTLPSKLESTVESNANKGAIFSCEINSYQTYPKVGLQPRSILCSLFHVRLYRAG